MEIRDGYEITSHGGAINSKNDRYLIDDLHKSFWLVCRDCLT